MLVNNNTSTLLVFEGIAFCYCRPMNNKEIRYQNLLQLYREVGSNWQRLADVSGTNVKYFNQCKPKPGSTRKGMGDKVARRLEEAMGKSVGWMDIPHEEWDSSALPEQESIPTATRIEELAANLPIDRELLAQVISDVDGMSVGLSTRLTPKERADMMAALYVQRIAVASGDNSITDDVAAGLASLLISRSFRR